MLAGVKLDYKENPKAPQRDSPMERPEAALKPTNFIWSYSEIAQKTAWATAEAGIYQKATYTLTPCECGGDIPAAIPRAEYILQVSEQTEGPKLSKAVQNLI